MYCYFWFSGLAGWILPFTLGLFSRFSIFHLISPHASFGGSRMESVDDSGFGLVYVMVWFLCDEMEEIWQVSECNMFVLRLSAGRYSPPVPTTLYSHYSINSKGLYVSNKFHLFGSTLFASPGHPSALSRVGNLLRPRNNRFKCASLTYIGAVK